MKRPRGTRAALLYHFAPRDDPVYTLCGPAVAPPGSWRAGLFLQNSVMYVCLRGLFRLRAATVMWELTGLKWTPEPTRIEIHFYVRYCLVSASRR